MMTMHEEDGFDPELAEILSLIVDEECVGSTLDVGIVLALAVREHYESQPYLDDKDIIGDKV